MRKSSSAQLHNIEFNLKDCRVGQSSIDRLPLRPETRRNSTSHLPRPPLAAEKTELEQLRVYNATLKRENEQLKRELQGYRRQGGKGCRTQTKAAGYREIIRGKMSSRVKSSRATQCDEGLMSTKEVSLQPISLTISDWYDQYRLAQKVPSLNDLQDCADRFFKDYCQNYAKLKSLFECLQCNKQQEGYKRLFDLIDLYKVPLLYQKSPQTLLRELSRSKDKMGRGKEKEQVCWEVLSPTETVTRFEGLLGKVCRSGQMLRALRGNEQVVKFVQKMQERV